MKVYYIFFLIFKCTFNFWDISPFNVKELILVVFFRKDYLSKVENMSIGKVNGKAVDSLSIYILGTRINFKKQYNNKSYFIFRYL